MSFTMTEEKYQGLLDRLTALEEHHNDVAVALDRLVSTQQVQELLVLIQGDLDTFSNTLTALEARVKALEEDPLEPY